MDPINTNKSAVVLANNQLLSSVLSLLVGWLRGRCQGVSKGWLDADRDAKGGKWDHQTHKADSIVLPMGVWAAAPVKLRTCAGAAWFPKGKEVSLGGSRLQPIRSPKCRLRGGPWVKGSLQVVFGLLTIYAGI